MAQCEPQEDSNQPRHQLSLIRISAVSLNKAWVVRQSLRQSEDFDQTGWMPRPVMVSIYLNLSESLVYGEVPCL